MQMKNDIIQDDLRSPSSFLIDIIVTAPSIVRLELISVAMCCCAVLNNYVKYIQAAFIHCLRCFNGQIRTSFDP